MKGLVLPGIGSFTIVDGEKISEEDIGSKYQCINYFLRIFLDNYIFSFFLENESIGLSRAQVATQCLLELNPDVRGDYIDEYPENVMSDTQDFFKHFTVVVATALPEK